MQWPVYASFPINAGFLARERIPIRHYPHRDPAQLDRRCRLRAIMMADEENRKNWDRPDLHYWKESDWRKFITPNDEPGLQYWNPGTELPELHLAEHLRPAQVRLVQR